MISNPDMFLQEFAEAGSDSFLVHWEGNANLHRTVQSIRALHKRAGELVDRSGELWCEPEIIRLKARFSAKDAEAASALLRSSLS